MVFVFSPSMTKYSKMKNIHKPPFLNNINKTAGRAE